jgi:Protein of unknown function (DUF1656)
MDQPSFSVRQSVEFLGFYLPPLVLCAGGAAVLFLILRWLLARLGLYHFVWHRPLFNLALYVLLLGGVVFFGDRVLP